MGYFVNMCVEMCVLFYPLISGCLTIVSFEVTYNQNHSDMRIIDSGQGYRVLCKIVVLETPFDAHQYGLKSTFSWVTSLLPINFRKVTKTLGCCHALKFLNLLLVRPDTWIQWPSVFFVTPSLFTTSTLNGPNTSTPILVKTVSVRLILNAGNGGMSGALKGVIERNRLVP